MYYSARFITYRNHAQCTVPYDAATVLDGVGYNVFQIQRAKFYRLAAKYVLTKPYCMWKKNDYNKSEDVL